MSGLDLSRGFFREILLPGFERDLLDLLSLIAIGTPGGSHCHGHDDEVSRDHGWGPAVLVLLPSRFPAGDTERINRVLQTLPREFCGHQAFCDVMVLDQLMLSVVGVKNAPTDPMEWLRIPEEWLFEITHRPLLLDRSGFATARFDAFARYPSDVWRKRLAAQLFWLSEWGPKHLKRAEARGDSCAAAMYWTRFSEVVAKTLFLLHHQYAPYHKWLFRIAGELSPWSCSTMELICGGWTATERYSITTEICGTICQEMERLAIPRTVIADPKHRLVYSDLPELLEYRQGIVRSIVDDHVRELPVGQAIVLPPTKPTETWVSTAMSSA